MTSTALFLRRFSLLLAFPLLVNAWGKIGHEIVGNLAWSLLSPSSQTEAAEILNTTSPSSSHCDEFCSPLALVADWADTVRHTAYYQWTAPLHFIDIRDQQIPGHCRVTNSSRCHFDYARDCPDDMCVAGAIVNYTHRVVEQPTVAGQREALKFLVHFVGDIHQPLHCSRTSDLGGNSIHVSYLNKTAAASSTVRRRAQRRRTTHHHSLNLHAVWDSSMIETALKLRYHGSRNEMEDSLLVLIDEARHSADWETIWTRCGGNGASQDCVSDWAEESIAHALQYAYANVNGTDIQSGDHLAYDYYLSREPVIREQLARAGVRLAATLEAALSGKD